MMTLKHIALSGEEFVYPTSHINYAPSSAFQNQAGEGEDSPPSTVWCYDAEGRALPITDGKCYVMNAEGRTVATYILSDNGPAACAQAPKAA